MAATVTIDDRFADVLRTLGNLQEGAETAVKRYAIEQIAERIELLREKCLAYEAKYGCDFEVFQARTAQDEGFVKQIETEVDKLWEQDLLDWEFCHKGIQDWTKTLETILLK
ncbi:MAG: hypothetical protein D6694_13750 [Gammaproteobacteria bacterium]|nr:MAG: hypothetical protein D6694_13750 [Gammaproteobacteria bacterium]